MRPGCSGRSRPPIPEPNPRPCRRWRWCPRTRIATSNSTWHHAAVRRAVAAQLMSGLRQARGGWAKSIRARIGHQNFELTQDASLLAMSAGRTCWPPFGRLARATRATVPPHRVTSSSIAVNGPATSSASFCTTGCGSRRVIYRGCIIVTLLTPSSR